jgi:hypothetical protein
MSSSFFSAGLRGIEATKQKEEQSRGNKYSCGRRVLKELL